MDCPVCKNAMITFELDDVEVDYCLNCRGIWLDAGELQMLLGDQELADQVMNSFRRAVDCKEKLRRCPICRKKMHKMLVGEGETPKLIDMCRKSDGLWFDQGELTEILQFGSFDNGNRIKNLLSEMFGGDTGTPVKDRD